MKTRSLKEHLQHLHDAQRRRLERLESRYAQLDTALDEAESLMATFSYAPDLSTSAANVAETDRSTGGPRKPR